MPPLFGLGLSIPDVVIISMTSSVVMFMIIDFLREISGLIGRKLRPAPEPPKPRKYRIKVFDDFGYPLRTYTMPMDQVTRVMGGIEADLDATKDGKP